MQKMIAKHGVRIRVATNKATKQFIHAFSEFLQFFWFYLSKKVLRSLHTFEKRKNVLVKFFLMKRGRYSRPFLHIAAMLVLGIGIAVAPFLADTYPAFSKDTLDQLKNASASAQEQSITVDGNVFETDISSKPRDKVITYTVQNGDTISTVAKKFGISTDTIRWANDLSSDDLSVGDELKILPVTGIAHKVESGDTVYSIAKKYGTDAQAIVDFPFNDFANPETFSLVVGQIVIVPDGVKPEENQPAPVRKQVYIAQEGPVPVSGGGFTWPIRGLVTQFPSWYHMALDIAAPYGSPIVSAQNGTVVSVSTGTYDGGYGNNVYIDNGAGLKSHYAHMSAVNVSVGQHVTAGSTVVGWIGLTGRTTGPHVHFEILKDGVLVNPVPYLP